MNIALPLLVATSLSTAAAAQQIAPPDAINPATLSQNARTMSLSTDTQVDMLTSQLKETRAELAALKQQMTAMAEAHRQTASTLTALDKRFRGHQHYTASEHVPTRSDGTILRPILVGKLTTRLSDTCSWTTFDAVVMAKDSLDTNHVIWNCKEP